MLGWRSNHSHFPFRPCCESPTFPSREGDADLRLHCSLTVLLQYVSAVSLVGASALPGVGLPGMMVRRTKVLGADDGSVLMRKLKQHAFRIALSFSDVYTSKQCVLMAGDGEGSINAQQKP